mmetsp:Transcript_11426/g.17998  ORF Transcript_11426/g.17998 Transcript_11426/m.17998 type:complete len:214 (-) Transcript_11426:59-700(-)
MASTQVSKLAVGPSRFPNFTFPKASTATTANIEYIRKSSSKILPNCGREANSVSRMIRMWENIAMSRSTRKRRKALAGCVTLGFWATAPTNVPHAMKRSNAFHKSLENPLVPYEIPNRRHSIINSTQKNMFWMSIAWENSADWLRCSAIINDTFVITHVMLHHWKYLESTMGRIFSAKALSGSRYRPRVGLCVLNCRRKRSNPRSVGDFPRMA